MASEIDDKLFELARFCVREQISLDFTGYESEKNIMEDITINGERCIRLELGNPKDPDLLSEFSEFVNTIIK